MRRCDRSHRAVVRAAAVIGAWTALAAGIAAEACTATAVVDEARKSRDVNGGESDEYRAAKDVTLEMIDREKIVRDTMTIEAGVGTLLLDMTRIKTATGGDLSVAAVDKAVDSIVVYHGYRPSWGYIKSNTFGATNTDIKLRDHMRLHLYEWHFFLQGRADGGPHALTGAGDSMVYAGDRFGTVPGATDPVAVEPTASAPAPVPDAPLRVKVDTYDYWAGKGIPGGAPAPIRAPAIDPTPAAAPAPAAPAPAAPAPAAPAPAAPAPAAVEVLNHAG